MHKYILLLFLALASCSPNEDQRGYVAEADVQSAIVVGQSDQNQVLEALGSPSAKSSFGEDTWYYIHTKRERELFFKPEVVEQKVLRIAFDAGGTVSSVEVFDQLPDEDFSYVKRTTPTEGHQMTVIEQLVGNLGRFNKPGSGVPGAPRGGPGGPGGTRGR